MSLNELFTLLGLLVTGIATLISYLALKRSSEARKRRVRPARRHKAGRNEPRSLGERLFLLLLVDQLPSGVWGASLEGAAPFYGHGGDPGSITVSTAACLAITAATGETTTEPITRYRNYLLARRTADGAFGMKRVLGTSKYPDAEVLVHSRHTATGARFFARYHGFEHRACIEAVRYLVSSDSRSVTGGWVDFGPINEDRADPVTAAFVLGFLEEVSVAARTRPELIGLYHHNDLDLVIGQGIDFIFGTNFRGEEGGWLYRYSSEEERATMLLNEFQYTADVLSNISASIRRLARRNGEAKSILADLLRKMDTYGGGLPRSLRLNLPCLDTSSNLLVAAAKLGLPRGDVARRLPHLIALAEKSEVLENSAASGWSSLLMHARDRQGRSLCVDPQRAAVLQKLASDLVCSEQSPEALGADAEYVSRLLKVRKSLQSS